MAGNCDAVLWVIPAKVGQPVGKGGRQHSAAEPA